MNAILNSIPLTSLDPAIVLQDIEEFPPAEGALRVRLRLELHEPDMARRKQLCTKLAGWAAAGGELQLSDRPGQALDVQLAEPPVLPSALQWTQPIRVIFEAAAVPYWRSLRAATVNCPANTAHTLPLRVPGNANPVPIEAQIRNASGNVVTIVTISTSLGAFVLENLSLAPGALLEIREDGGLPVILANGTSALANRAVLSSDRLLIPSGQESAVTVTADQAVDVSLSARGAWF